MSEYYDPERDAGPQSPPLVAVRPKATPSPSPPPVVTRPVRISSPAHNVSSPSSKRRGFPNRRKGRTRPSQGDFVLIRTMYPNRPDIAREVGERALNSDSGSEADDEDMEDRPATVEPAPSSPVISHSTPHRPSVVDLQATAQKALDSSTTAPAKLPPPFPRDSVVEIDNQSRGVIDAEVRASHARPTISPNGIQTIANGVESISSASGPREKDATSPNPAGERHESLANGYPDGESLATSPNLGQLTIPQSRGSPSQKLPALQPPHSPRDTAASPNQERRLPGFRHLSEIAETAIHEQQDPSRANSYPHRPSISSSTHSPTSVTRQLSISSARSPNSTFPPFSATSPISANSESASKDLFLRSGQSGLTLFSPRRPSQASDGAPYSATLHSASTSNENYQSSEGLSPGTQVASLDSQTHRMSIDSTYGSRTLPPPMGSNIQHIPAHGSGGFKCEHPGCNAQPFQTQYLLK